MRDDHAKTGREADALDRERALDPLADELLRAGERDTLGHRERLNDRGEPVELPRCPSCGDPHDGEAVLCPGCRPDDATRLGGRGPV